MRDAACDRTGADHQHWMPIDPARETLHATARAKRSSPWEQPTLTRLPSTSCRL